jgi:hypothetical protein
MPDGAANAAMQPTTTLDAVRARVAPGVEASPVVQAGRRDKRTAKVIYQAQALRRAFGRHAALTFLLAKRIPSALSARVLAVPDHQLRR